MTPQEITRDPNFLALPPVERIKVLRRVDPNFEGLAPDARLKVVLSLGSAPAEATPPPPTPQRTIQDSARDLVGMGPEGASAILPTAAGVVKGAAKDAARAGLGAARMGMTAIGLPPSAGGPAVQQWFEDADQGLRPETKDQENGAILSTMLQYALPGGAAAKGTQGAGLAARAGAQAATAGTVSEARGGSAGENAVQAILGAAGPVGGAFASKVAAKLPGGMVNSLIKPLEKAFRFGRDPGRAVAEEGIVAATLPRLQIKVGARLQQVGNEIGELLKQADGKNAPLIDLSAATVPLREAAREALRVGDNGLHDRLLQFADAPIFAERPVVGLVEAAGIKRTIGNAMKWTGEAYEAPLNAAKAQVYRLINDAIDSAADDVGLAGVKKLNARYADLLTAAKSIERTANIAQRQANVSLTDVTTGGAGAAMTGDPSGGLALAGLRRALATTAATTTAAQAARVPGTAGAQSAGDMIRRLIQAMVARQQGEPAQP